VAASRPNSLIPCSNSAHSLIFAIYFACSGEFAFLFGRRKPLRLLALRRATDRGFAKLRCYFGCIPNSEAISMVRKRDSNPRPHHYELHAPLFYKVLVILNSSVSRRNLLTKTDTFCRHPCASK